MKAIVVLSLSLSLLAAAPFAAAQGKTPSTSDGIAVDEGSRMRNLVPAAQLEAEAARQYAALKKQAAEKGVLRPDNDPQVQRLRAIAQRIIPHTNRWNANAGKWKWEVNLIGVKEVNAFCMPGGKIAFFAGLIDTLKLTDDEVAIVMGHEIAHALREHARERMAKGSLLSLGATGLSAILGLGDLGQFAMRQGAQLWLLKFSRTHETDADVVGLDVVARAGFDPRAGVTLWQKMGALNKSAPPQWFSTHPPGENRIAEIRSRLPSVMPLYAKTKGATVSALPPYKTNVQGIAAVN